MKKNLLFIFALLVLLFSAEGQTVIRGPYLQSPTSNSIKICWRTDSLTNSRVYYGSSISNMSAYVDSTTLTTEHRVKISGLSPFTQYYYSVGSTAATLSGPDTLQHFTTSPIIGTVQPIRAWVIGDFGKASTAQGLVRDSYVRYTQGTHTDLWLWVGDNAYPDGTDDEFQQKVFDSITGYYRLFKYIPFMPAPGNHDYNSISPVPGTVDPMLQTGPYLNLIDPPIEGEAGGVPSHTKLYYSYDYGNVHFVSLNSELGSTTPAWDYTGAYASTFTFSPMTTWLEADLAATDKQWIVAYWHQLPYSSGDVFSDDFWELYMNAMRKNINPILESHGVDLVLCGHDHDYQRSYLINGHYGYSSTFTSSMLIDGSSGNMTIGLPYIKDTVGGTANKGTVYVCAGNSGAGNPEGWSPHPALYWGDDCDTCIGSFVLDINGGRLDGKYLHANGSIRDQFTIFKGIPSAINELKLPEGALKIIPNPFSEQTKVEYTLTERSDFALEMFDISGKKVMNIYKGKSDSGTYTYLLNTGKLGLSKGAYVLKLTAGGKSTSQKLINTE